MKKNNVIKYTSFASLAFVMSIFSTSCTMAEFKGFADGTTEVLKTTKDITGKVKEVGAAADAD